MRLLIVDDDAGLRALLRATFESFDVLVDEAEDARQAAARIAAARPEVIVLDVVMPGIDGLEFCRRLKADPATSDIRVILLTGSEGGTRAASDSAGADAFVAKPFSPLELASIVDELVTEAA